MVELHISLVINNNTINTTLHVNIESYVYTLYYYPKSIICVPFLSHKTLKQLEICIVHVYQQWSGATDRFHLA